MKPKHKAVLACIVAFGCGAGVGHILTRTRLERIFAADLTKESEKMKRKYAKLHKGDEFSTPEGARQALEAERETDVAEGMPDEAREALVRYSGKTVPGIVDPDDQTKRDVSTADIYQEFAKKRRLEAEALKDSTEPPMEKPIVRQNIWDPDHPAVVNPMTPDNIDPDGDALRNGDKPYLMSFDEYCEDRHFEETEVVFFTGDQTVADENDEPIPHGQVEEMFGWDNLSKFGDDYVIHIASPKFGKKFQVTRTDGSFANMVGLDPAEGDSG